MSCVVCHNELEFIEAVPTSKRSAEIFVCAFCGLVQTFPRDIPGNHKRSFSSGADFGNVRYGKGFRAFHNWTMFRERYKRKQITRVLDIGAGKGAFAKCVLDSEPDVFYVAIEPDVGLLNTWPSQLKYVNKLGIAVEDALLATKYDLIYCSHTLEHVVDPLDVLHKIRDWLAPAGVALIEVPDLAYLAYAAMIEEFFIDKHLTHFCAPTLFATLLAAGLYAGDGVVPSEGNLTALCEIGLLEPPKELDHLAAWSKETISEYRRTQQAHMNLLPAAVKAINQMDDVVLWGAGRIYHAFLDAGLDRGIPVVDSYLWGASGNVANPTLIQTSEAKTVIILSRLYYDEISRTARMLREDINIRSWHDFLPAHETAHSPLKSEGRL